MLALLVFLLCCSVSANALKYLDAGELDELTMDFLQYLKTLLQMQNPLKLMPLSNEHMKDTDVDIVFSASELLAKDLGDFDLINTTVSLSAVSFAVMFGKAQVAGNFQVNGTYEGMTVRGSGTISVNFKDFVQTAEIKFTNLEDNIQMDEMKLDFTVGKYQIKEHGLAVSGMSPKQVVQFLTDQVHNFVESNRLYICGHTAEILKEGMNEMMYGKNIHEVIAMLKKLIPSTPSPV